MKRFHNATTRFCRPKIDDQAEQLLVHLHRHRKTTRALGTGETRRMGTHTPGHGDHVRYSVLLLPRRRGGYHPRNIEPATVLVQVGNTLVQKRHIVTPATRRRQPSSGTTRMVRTAEKLQLNNTGTARIPPTPVIEQH